VLKAFSTLKKDDGFLFDCEIEEEFGYDSRKLHEVCINHKLAIYFENEILPIIGASDQKYFVDIEFNREGINKKKLIKFNGEELVVRPDIIIHNRKSGEQKKNILIVECKKKKKGARLPEIEEDKKKIRAFMQNDKYRYSFGLQVVYGKDEIKGTLFYKNGEAIRQGEIVTS
jgi:hypothetical protein